MVGTDFYAAYENNGMTVIVFDGVVKVCNLAGVCVTVRAGQVSTVRNGAIVPLIVIPIVTTRGNSPPSATPTKGFLPPACAP